MKCLFGSGGGAKFGALAGAGLELLENGYSHQIFGGISSSALLAVPLALSKDRPELKQQILDFSLRVNDVWKKIFCGLIKLSPVNKKGKFSWTSIARAVAGYNSFGVQEEKRLLDELMPKHLFDLYKDGDYADCYVMSVTADDAKRHIYNVKDMNHEDYKSATAGSTKIPIFTEPEFFRGQHHYDGGLRNHTPSTKIIQQILSEGQNISKVVSLYARSEEVAFKAKLQPENIIEAIIMTITIMSMEISKRDQEQEFALCEKHNIPLVQIFLETDLGIYESNIEKLKSLEQIGRNAVKQKISQIL